MSILSIGQSALAVAQAGLATTANNIANASTPGYSDEQIIQTEGSGQSTGSGFMGTGVQVATVQRLYNSFLATQQNTTQTSYSSLNTNYTQISQLNNMFASSTTGLSPTIQNFFNSVQTATSDPGAASSLEGVLSSAQALATQFQSTSAQLSQVNDGVNAQIVSTVQSINNYASQIASLNSSIQTAESTSAGQVPNDLLDQRDEAVANLSKDTNVSVVPQGNEYNVFIGNGQPLVVGSQSYAMTPITSPTNTDQLEVGYVNKGVISQIPENSLTGGSLGGLLQFRSQSLVPTQNALGQMAVGLASAVNAQQELGQDQAGNVGAAVSPMFTVGSPITTANANNTGNLQVTTTVTNPNALTTSNYSLQFDGTDYNLTNLSDKTVVNLGPTLPASSDGLTFNAASGTPATGDNFLIQPTAAAAAGFGVAITNTSQIAMAAPIVTNASSANTGTGQINAGVVNGQLTLPNDTVSIVFNKPATTFTATDTTTGTVLGSNVAYTAGDNITYNSTTGITSNPPGTSSVAGDMWTVQVSGSPAVGDTFTVGPNTSASGDSRNGLLMAALQTSKTLDNSTTSIQGAYAQLVSTIGNQTAQLQATSTAANTELTNATSAQQAVSGVNLDEEASKLLQYQQAYQAAAKLMSTVSQLFSTLLSELP